MNGSVPDLSNTVRAKPIESLHLKFRTTGVLRRLGIMTTGQLVDWSAKNTEIPRGAGPETLRDLDDALNSLCLSVDRHGTVDWIEYAKRRRFIILPRKERRDWAARDFLRDLPAVVKEAVQIRFGASGSMILQNHFLARWKNRQSLADVGREVGVSREWTRKVGADIIEMFRGIILEENYRGCEFRIRPEFLTPLRTLSKALKPDLNCALSYSDWESALIKIWKVRPVQVASTGRLILDILGFKEIDFRDENRLSVILPRKRSSEAAGRVLREIEYLLTVRYPNGLRPNELLGKLRDKLGTQTPLVAELPALVRSIRALETKKFHARYRAQANSLKKGADHYERLLRQAGKPLHLKDIIRRARRPGRRHAFTQQEGVSNALSTDPRFVPVAQSGFWALVEWGHIETRTITDLAADLIKKLRCPIDQNRLYTLIKARRSVAKDSIRALLRSDSRFKRTGTNEWALR